MLVCDLHCSKHPPLGTCIAVCNNTVSLPDTTELFFSFPLLRKDLPMGEEATGIAHASQIGTSCYPAHQTWSLGCFTWTCTLKSQPKLSALTKFCSHTFCSLQQVSLAASTWVERPAIHSQRHFRYIYQLPKLPTQQYCIKETTIHFLLECNAAQRTELFCGLSNVYWHQTRRNLIRGSQDAPVETNKKLFINYLHETNRFGWLPYSLWFNVYLMVVVFLFARWLLCSWPRLYRWPQHVQWWSQGE